VTSDVRAGADRQYARGDRAGRWLDSVESCPSPLSARVARKIVRFYNRDTMTAATSMHV